MGKNNNFSAAICTLGCRVNQYESDCIISEFINLGVEIKDFGEICDVYVINTCTVTAGSDKKSKQMIRRAKRLNNDAIIAVCGCFSQRNPDVFKSDLTVDIVFGTSEKNKIPKIALETMEMRNAECGMRNFVKPISEYKTYENISVYQSEKTRAYIKIQDGCDCNCSYCIIPQVRGCVKSRGYADIYGEVKRFNDMGYHEIVLTGIEISSYGKNHPPSADGTLFCERGQGEKTHQILCLLSQKEVAPQSRWILPKSANLINLLEKLNAEPELKNITSIRLSSVDPSLIKKDFIDRIANLEKFANHFHLSLQSGSTRILNLMRRKYNAETVIKNIEYAKNIIKDLNLTADIIVGFPSETDEDFEKSVEIAQLLNIYHAHIFTYSKRPGTDAAEFENQVGENIKNERSKKLSETCEKIKEEIHRTNMGKEFDVIPEDLTRDEFYTAKTRNFMDVKIKARDNKSLHGSVQRVKIIGFDRDFLYGEIL